ncbi:hypothetical protein D9757_014832 [Collybiopsis confluens]|uniref:Ubiquitin-like protease family profile domain-containing protein n=1 Tax=Collybiopsis confluens TaxID=2823264 RepID=A0A8H5GE24_9AGAR|nr:hypothetical protein D9757_014832 [Collybiopsis confluens]
MLPQALLTSIQMPKFQSQTCDNPRGCTQTLIQPFGMVRVCSAEVLSRLLGLAFDIYPWVPTRELTSHSFNVDESISQISGPKTDDDALTVLQRIEQLSKSAHQFLDLCLIGDSLALAFKHHERLVSQKNITVFLCNCDRLMRRLLNVAEGTETCLFDWLDTHPTATALKLRALMVNLMVLIQNVSVRSWNALGPTRWLDDGIMNYFIKKWCSGSESRKTLGLSTWFAGRFIFADNRCMRARSDMLTMEDEMIVSRWCRAAEKDQGLHTGSWDRVFIPINENNLHWYSACINFNEKRIDIYDSLAEVFLSNKRKPMELKKKNTPTMLKYSAAYGDARFS